MTNGTEGGFPAVGTPADALLAELTDMHAGDIDWRGGRSFSLVYNPDDEQLEHLLDQAGVLYLHENGLNPFKYPSLIQIEADVVAWAADLVHTHPKAGSMTSGGTESIFLAVHTAREHAGLHRGVATPNIVTADTVHPALAKACHYLRIEHRRAPVGEDLRAVPEAMAALVDDQTVLVVGSAPCYPFGVIDPIPELAAMAADRDVLCHVDACLGGWMLPFWERLGEPVPPWDFRVEGVTSLSADVHKYGYAFKGASTVLYADPEMVKHQWFVYDDWPGGLYGSVTTAGTRPGAPMAGAWTAIRHLGEVGYLAKAAQVRDATRALQAGIGGIEGLEVHGDPDMSVFEFGSPTVDIGAVGDRMDDRGWHLDRQQGGLHAMLFPYHLKVVDELVADLADAVADHGESRGAAAGYGGIVA
jgi:glutamate/tyrosine decarboxylase-like PLP-dependent enzyme